MSNLINNTSIPDRLEILFKKKRFVLDKNSIIGDGGEGVLYSLAHEGKNWAIKIIYPHMRTAARMNKLTAMIGRKPSLPNRTVKPLDVITDAQTTKVIGLAMELVDIDKYDKLIWWFKDSYRTANQITFEDICHVFYELLDELERIHNAGYVIGDFNPGGILILKKQFWNDKNANNRIKLVDADSMEFDNFPCVVFSLAWFDYKLAPVLKDLGKDKIYSKLSDYFSFDALFFQALTRAGVYDGFHPMYTDVKNLMTRGLTVLHKDVEYPDYAVDYKVLPPDFVTHFTKSFVDGERKLFPKNVLGKAIGLKVDLTQLPPQIVDLPMKTFNILLENIGNIVDFVIIGDEIHLLCEQNNVYYYLVKQGSKLQKYDIVSQIHYVNISILNPYYILIKNNTGKLANTLAEFEIYDVKTKTSKGYYTQAGYLGEHLVGGGNGELFTASNNALIAQPLVGNTYRTLRSVNSFTRIKSDPGSGNVVGYMRSGMSYLFFFKRDNNVYDVYLDQLEQGETMQPDDFCALWGKNSALLIRFTTHQGSRRTLITEVNLSATFVGDERIIGQTRIYKDELFNPINSAAYVVHSNQSYIFYATQAGVMRENLHTSETKLFQNTKRVATKGDTLRFWNNVLLLIKPTGKVITISL